MVFRSVFVFLSLLACVLPVHAAFWDKSFPTIDFPESMQIEVVTQGMVMNGLNTQIYKFESSDSADELAVHFQQQWPGELARKVVEPWDVLSHHEGGYLLTIQMRESSLGMVQGLITITDVFQALADKRNVPRIDVPMLSNTRVIQHLQANDYGRESQTYILQNTDSVHENLDFYREHFMTQGYEPITRRALAKGQDAGVMVLNRGNEQMNFAAVERNGQTLITIIKVRK